MLTPRKKIKFYPIDILGVIGLLLVWQILSLIIGPTRLPSPYVVAVKALTIFVYSSEIVTQGAGGENILPHISYTIIRTLSGFASGASLGIILGLVIGRNRVIREFVEVPIEAIRAIPPLGLIPFIILWFGPEPFTQFLLITIYSFLVVVIYTRNAIRNVNPIYLQFAKTLGANDRIAFRTVVLPATIPELIGGLRVALAMSWGIEVVAEMMGAPYGMGKFFSILIPFFATTSVFAGIVVIVIVALIFDRIFVMALKYLTKWVPKGEI